ncbi:MAG: uracil phosphoribosyltransferase [Candidatus Nomurabacteria bacterium]|jgi:uracil phosphoribosyltransferase|nr:uracil phosphoribosyltransferase [Candidatus Nomurabacteria bacterium]
MANFSTDTVKVIDHPLVQHKLAILRDKYTGTQQFSDLISEIATFMCYEATRDLPLGPTPVETPICTCQAQMIDDRKLALVPILRAGTGMLDGARQAIPAAKVGHIGIYRDHETRQPVDYYAKFPAEIEKRRVLLLDPMLATGGTAVDAISKLKKCGVPGERIKFLCIIAAPEGLEIVQKAHPDVLVYTCHIDDYLNEDAYIVPGLGDAGDRIFGTK